MEDSRIQRIKSGSITCECVTSYTKTALNIPNVDALNSPKIFIPSWAKISPKKRCCNNWLPFSVQKSPDIVPYRPVRTISMSNQ